MRCFGKTKCGWNLAASTLVRVSEQSGVMDRMVDYLVTKVVKDHDERKQAVNPYMGARTVCDRCGAVITINSTFDAYSLSHQIPSHPQTSEDSEGLVKYCTKCGRALSVDANYCDRCRNPQFRMVAIVD